MANDKGKIAIKKSGNKKTNNKKKNSSKKVTEEKKSTKLVETKKTKKEVEKKLVREPEKKGISSKFFNKSYSLFDVIFFVIIISITCILLTSQFIVHKYKLRGSLCSSSLSTDKDLQEFTSVYKEIIDNYYEEINKTDMIDSAIDGMLGFLEDTYSIHMDSSQSDSFDENLEGTYQGIGIVLHGKEIIEIYEPSSASEGGLKVGDIVLEIGGEKISDENVYEVIQNVREKLGDTLSIVVEREGREIKKKLDVRKVNLPIVTSNFVEINKKKIGYISISSFTSNSSEQFSELLIELENKNKIDALIIDVRDNGGGYLEQAAHIASLFVKKGKVIYSLEDKKNKSDVKDTDKESRDYPLVILINGSSASASEILAAALKDNNNAIIVGKTSFGKGKVQTTKKLDDGTMLKYTSSKWLRPNGECVDGVGIIPDYEVEQKENEDSQYEKAIDLLK